VEYLPKTNRFKPTPIALVKTERNKKPQNTKKKRGRNWIYKLLTTTPLPSPFLSNS
jgi:hypothetical protein